MDDVWGSDSEKNKPISRLEKRVWLIVGLIIGGPVLAYGCLYAIVIGPFILNDWIYSGSATGTKAAQRAEKYIGAGDWKTYATNIRAEWKAPGFQNGPSEKITFQIPLDKFATFDQRLRSSWKWKLKSSSKNDGTVADPNATPAVNHFRNGYYDSITINGYTGKVILDHVEP